MAQCVPSTRRIRSVRFDSHLGEHFAPFALKGSEILEMRLPDRVARELGCHLRSVVVSIQQFVDQDDDLLERLGLRVADRGGTDGRRFGHDRRGTA
jgi:hypothetical protein